MATWQFELNAVCGETGTLLTAEHQERAVSFLDTLLSRAEESEGWLLFGEVNGNRIDVAFDDSSTEVDVRIDARTDAETFITLVCILVNHIGCTFYSAELDEFVAADTQAVKSALMRSQAWSFALDPHAFLASSNHWQVRQRP